MYKEVWKECFASICAIKFLDYTHNYLGSGTGFKVENFIITNHHVFMGYLAAEYIEISFVKEDGNTVSALKRYHKTDFLNMLRDSLPESSWDFAILKLPEKDFEGIPSLEFSNDQIQIGESTAILGYQFLQPNLSIKRGIISSLLKEAGVNKIQIDSSVNKGNSGGPLINLSNKKVIGIVTRKGTGLSDAFGELMKSYDQNIEYLQKSPATMIIGDFNPKEILIINQEQMKRTAREIERSSNVGIGYAYSLDKVQEFFK
ncbi:serine protease [Chryseobacterium sp. OSA05B]|uniref:S1 family peptidase n=1 Tax=Chryseobacterium sp. OSA05B TaxID=2862650 RepID=UPI001CBA9B0F|nr:serine protease [Chryseobacterium sp. OSA05B]